MAVVLAFRIAIVLAPPAAAGSMRVIRSLEGPGGGQTLERGTALYNRLKDPGESDEDLSAALADKWDTLVEVATFTGTFSLRKLHVVWSLAGGTAAGEDVRVCTFHMIKLASGSPVDTWDEADFVAAEGYFDTWWTALKPSYRSTVVLSQYRWYKAGPDDVPPQEPVRVVDKSVAGTDSSGVMVPPQIATSVTERTATRSHWGRFYLPGPTSPAYTNTTGRFSTAWITAVANATDTLYEALRTASKPVVVYSIEKPERSPTADPPWQTKTATLAAQDALALECSKIQVDDVPDVIRSRRFDTPLLKLVRDIG